MEPQTCEDCDMRSPSPEPASTSMALEEEKQRGDTERECACELERPRVSSVQSKPSWGSPSQAAELEARLASKGLAYGPSRSPYASHPLLEGLPDTNALQKQLPPEGVPEGPSAPQNPNQAYPSVADRPPQYAGAGSDEPVAGTPSLGWTNPDTQPRYERLLLPCEDPQCWMHIEKQLLEVVQNPTWEEAIQSLHCLAHISQLVGRHQQVMLETFYAFARLPGAQKYEFLLRDIAMWALDVARLFRVPVPLLTQNSNSEIHLSREQARCLLSLMFWCAFPKRASQSLFSQSSSLIRVLGMPKERLEAQVAKIFCFFSYFAAVKDDSQLQEEICFRRVARVLSRVESVGCTLVQISPQEGLQIEQIADVLQVDFADKSFGGGVLGQGSAQEELMMLSYMEPIVGVLLIEQLLDHEVVYVTGIRNFNTYSGFSSSFRWTGAVPKPKTDKRVLVAMDASDYRRCESAQYSKVSIDRELSKAILAFSHANTQRDVPIVTGNWGCGVFKGDLQLKFMIQWLAASFSQRNLRYFSWNKPELLHADEMTEILSAVPPRQLLSLLYQFAPSAGTMELFSFLRWQVPHSRQ